MGQPKQLLPLGSKPVIRHCIDSIISAGIQEIVAVVNARVQTDGHALSGLPVRVAINFNDASDMAASLRIGLQALDQSFSGVLVCLADHPLSSIATLKTLARAHIGSPDRIIIPSFNGFRGHPSLFPLTILQEIFVVDTLRDIVKMDEGRVQVVDVPDEGVLFNMDTPEDYQKMLKQVCG